MASFAQLDENNVVINVIKIANDSDIIDENGNESEELGIAKCKALFGEDTNWKQTWFGKNPSRYRLAAIGGKYDPVHNIFTRKVLWDSWVLNTSTYEWEPPVARPEAITETPEDWQWDEQSVSWVKIEIPKPFGFEDSVEWSPTDREWIFKEQTQEEQE